MKHSHKIKVLAVLFNCVAAILFFPFLVAQWIRKRPARAEYRRILIVELWGIGDLVLMSSIMSDIRNAFPSAQVSVLCKSAGKALLGNSAMCDEFIEFDFPWTHFSGKYRLTEWDWRGLVRTVKKLREKKFDVALAARGDGRENLLLFITGAKRRIGYGWKGGGFFLTDRLIYDAGHMHRVDAWAGVVRHAGIAVERPHPQLSVSKDAETRVDNFLKTHERGHGGLLVGIHPGASRKIRCWPLEKFARVAESVRERYGATIAVFVEPDGYGELIPIRGEYVKARLPLEDLVACIKRLDLLICNESGPMHIAAAFDVPVVAIFGAGVPTKFSPCGFRHSVVIKDDIPCRPCFDHCTQAEPLCITGITEADVLAHVDRRLEELITSP